MKTQEFSMKKAAFFLWVGLAMVQSARAWDVCDLQKQTIDPQWGFTQEQISEYQKKLTNECQLSKLHQDLSKKAERDFGISLNQISYYQALRFVETGFYVNAEYRNTPVPLIYQRYRSMYNLPLDQRSSEIWRNWAFGIRQLTPWSNAVQQGRKFDLQSLTQVHKNLFAFSDERGDFAHNPEPGKIKFATDQDNPWWKFKSTQEGLDAQAKVQQINAYYKELGLLAELDEGSNPQINQILSVRNLSGVYAIYSGDTRANPKHLEKLFLFLDSVFSQAAQGQPLRWKKALLTPGEAAYLAQQHFVGIHPFYEGNGRTSRFIQELVLTSFQLPPGSSGDLMNIDVLTHPKEYYQIAMEKTAAQLAEVQKCLEQVYPAVVSQSGKLSAADPASIPYRCRLLN